MKNKIKTEGIKYTGSKKEILHKILDITKKYDIESILDGFSGTTRVAQMYKKNGYNVDANDISIYSKVFADCYLLNNKPKSHYVEKIKHLNELPGVVGWFTENYGGLVTDNIKGNAFQIDGKKSPWQRHNTMKLDAIRREIDIISEDDIEKSILLTSLIIALDKVDNTLGHQVAYLKKWSKRSYNILDLKVPELIIGDGIYNSTSGDIFTIDKEYDLIYLDPPYGTNSTKMPTSRVRYQSYYHIWSTIIKNDKPDLVGAAKRRYEFSSDKLPGVVSAFESTDYEVVKKSISDLMKLNSRYFLFSYNNKSKITITDLIEIFEEYNLLETLKFSHKENVMKNMTKEGKWIGDTSDNFEYLFLIEKNK